MLFFEPTLQDVLLSSDVHVEHRLFSVRFMCTPWPDRVKSSSNYSKYIMSVIDHMTHFLVMVAISD